MKKGYEKLIRRRDSRAKLLELNKIREEEDTKEMEEKEEEREEEEVKENKEGRKNAGEGKVDEEIKEEEKGKKEKERKIKKIKEKAKEKAKDLKTIKDIKDIKDIKEKTLRRKDSNCDKSDKPKVDETFSLDKILNLLNSEIGRENMRKIIRFPNYSQTTVNELTVVFEMMPIYDRLIGRKENDLIVEALALKLIRKCNYLNVNFPRKLESDLKELSEKISNKYITNDKGEISNSYEFEKDFIPIIKSLYTYLTQRNYAVLKKYWEEKFGPNSVVIRGLANMF